MPIQVQPREGQRNEPKEKKDILDDLLKGLQIAAGISGLAVNYQRFQEISQNRELNDLKLESGKFALENQKQGVLTTPQVLDAAHKGASFGPPTSGASDIRYRDAEGNIRTAGLSFPGKASPVKHSTTEVERDGKRFQLNYNPQTGKEISAVELGPVKESAGGRQNAVQAKKSGVFEVGYLAEQQYRDAVAQGQKAGDWDPTSYGDFVDNSSLAPRFLRNDKALAARDAADSWIDTFLRDESGAAIPDSERDNFYRIYFPQKGDPAEAVANKERLRWQKMNNARTAANLEPLDYQPGPAVGGPGTAMAKEPTAEDMQAIDWAKQNKNDPRAQEILKLWGLQ